MAGKPGAKKTGWTDAQRELKKWEAHQLSCEGFNYSDIARKLGCSAPMARRLVLDSIEELSDFRKEQGMDVQEYAAQIQRHIRQEALERVKAFPASKDSLAVPALLTAASQAGEREGRALGAFIDRRKVDVMGELPMKITVNFDHASKVLPRAPEQLANPDIVDAEVVDA